MPSLGSADEASLEAELRTQAPDLVGYLPDGVQLTDLVRLHARQVVDEIRMALGERYAPDALSTDPLPAEVRTLVAFGVLAGIARDCYRNLESGEAEWVRVYWERYEQRLVDLRDGRMILPLPAVAASRVGAQVAGEPRRLTLNDTLAATEGVRDLDGVW